MNPSDRLLAPHDVFKEAVRYFALVSVNILVERRPGEFLYVLRKNAPARGKWWLPGGRVFNGETIADATLHVLKQETGLTGTLVAVCPTFIEEIWSTADFTEDDWGENYDRASKTIHYLSAIAYVKVDPVSEIRLDNQSEQWKWSEKPLDDHPFLHRYFIEMEKVGYRLRL